MFETTNLFLLSIPMAHCHVSLSIAVCFKETIPGITPSSTCFWGTAIYTGFIVYVYKDIYIYISLSVHCISHLVDSRQSIWRYQKGMGGLKMHHEGPGPVLLKGAGEVRQRPATNHLPRPPLCYPDMPRGMNTGSEGFWINDLESSGPHNPLMLRIAFGFPLTFPWISMPKKEIRHVPWRSRKWVRFESRFNPNYGTFWSLGPSLKIRLPKWVNHRIPHKKCWKNWGIGHYPKFGHTMTSPKIILLVINPRISVYKYIYIQIHNI